MEDKFINIMYLYKSDIYRLAYSYVKNKLDAEDITQNTFVKLFKHNSILNQDKNSIKKWLIKVCINESKTYLLSAWKRKVTSFKDNEENNIKDEKVNDSILDSIMILNKNYRVVLYLYYYEEYSVKEIADILKVSETCIQTRLFRARETLKQILKEDIN